MRRRAGRVAVTVAIVGAVVGGCGSGPSQLNSAVIIGSQSVPLGQVQSRIDVALAKTATVAQLAAQGVTTPDIARDVVTRAIVHDLLDRTATADGISVSDAQVDAYLAPKGGLAAAVASSLYDESTLRERVRDQLVAIELAKRDVDRLVVVVDVTAAATREAADALARTAAAGGSGADGVFAGNNAQRNVSFRASTDPAEATMAVFGTPAGQVVVFQPSPGQSGWIVLRVDQRITDAPPAQPSVVSQIDESTLTGIGERLLQPLSEQLGVRVNPRYGVWDPVSMRVVGQGQEIGAIVVPAVAG